MTVIDDAFLQGLSDRLQILNLRPDRDRTELKELRKFKLDLDFVNPEHLQVNLEKLEALILKTENILRR